MTMLCFLFQPIEDGLDPLAQLEKKQDAIFARLADLKQTLDELSTKYKAPKLTATASVKKERLSVDKSSDSSSKSPLVFLILTLSQKTNFTHFQIQSGSQGHF